jgi:hypothetical protein
MDKAILEFLFVGPLFSIFKVMNQIRRDIMGLKEQIDAYTTAVDNNTKAVTDSTVELGKDLKDLQDKLEAKDAIDPEVQASLDKLGASVQKQSDSLTDLAALDIPDSSSVPATGGTVVDPGGFTSPGQVPASDSPGEPNVPDQPVSTGDGDNASAPTDSDSAVTSEVSPEDV